MEKMELHHAPCSSGKALNVSNTPTVDGPKRRASCSTSDISLQTSVGIPLRGASVGDKGEQVSPCHSEHLTERKTSFSFPGPAEPPPGLQG